MIIRQPYAQSVDIHQPSSSSCFVSPSNDVYSERPVLYSTELNKCVNALKTEKPSPILEIIVQPEPHFRFRYISEMKARSSDVNKFSSHGSLSQSDQNGRECSPTVRLRNFEGTAIIRCLLYQAIKNGEKPQLHPNYLWRKTKNGTIETGPIYVNVNKTNKWTAEFTGLSIIRAIQKDIEASPIKKKIKQMKSNNSDRVVMGFEAFEQTNNQKLIVGPVFSIPICNSRKVLIQIECFRWLNYFYFSKHHSGFIENMRYFII